MDYRKQRNSSLDKDLSIAFTGKQLASSPPFYEDIETIQSLVALPNEYYSAFYKIPLENFLAIYQVLDIGHIQLKLKRIIKALKIRRSYNLPLGVKPEDVREKKDLWTYVIFVSALLYNLPDITRYKILHKNPNNIHDYTLWNPYLGAIGSWKYFLRLMRKLNYLQLQYQHLLLCDISSLKPMANQKKKPQRVTCYKAREAS
jgi:hypothetical protein